MSKVREDVADMLRAGATYRQIIARLGVRQATIAATRKAYRIPLPAGRTGRHRDTPGAADVDAAIAAMLRAGATYTEVREQLHVSAQRISGVRLEQKIPVPAGRCPGHNGPRTPEQTLAQYSRPAADGHTTWTGPTDGAGKPTIWTRHQALSGWRVAFLAHHGREPDGRVQVACDQPRCIAGPHLTDRRIRQANQRADTAFEQIFGT
ncbi:hypothetical protein SCAB_64771 [Streptomyces scabiei 87.22]|uniref:Uncharacterized protein n=1 Tax=Streptomyces scabiei (strain 87.22) TaxID=680198 RepID=C9ZE48_STRSW|nr:hypothetical protein [Streptomyces scabiei]MBP5931893.1 hypothetical protein [Streptomyces sp. LBUM 1479]MDX3053351.1 hypothetical protein [Streptomyces scabiei]MDX3078718.1 hypothetical protein [Streptomyces scabiei]MDX3179091.1 hypothetical protein [Streptomyces scabiei]MDX3271211.1 hypothetical protein [Streptomyces scabiei]